jgi:hypothetical protein
VRVIILADILRTACRPALIARWRGNSKRLGTRWLGFMHFFSVCQLNLPNITKILWISDLIKIFLDFRHIFFGSKTCCRAADLQPNCKYLFRVRAQNLAGVSIFKSVIIVLKLEMHPISA